MGGFFGDVTRIAFRSNLKNLLYETGGIVIFGAHSNVGGLFAVEMKRLATGFLTPVELDTELRDHIAQ